MVGKGLAADEKSTFAASVFGLQINQYTKDGLLVRTFSLGHTGPQAGWFDFPTPLNSVIDPKTGDSIVTSEEQWFGRIIVYRLPNNLQRFSGPDRGE